MDEMRVYHLGYRSGGSDQHVRSLMSDPRMLLIDTRKSPRSSYDPAWCKDDTSIPGGHVIPGLQSQWGERYRWAGMYLGNINYWHKGAPIKIADIETGIRGLRYYLVRGYSLILMCQCSVVEDCHRMVIMRELKVVMPEVQFFAADGKPEQIEVVA